MSSDLILKESRTLPLAERIELCQTMWDEIRSSKELTPGEAEFIDSRLQEYLNHPTDIVPLEEAKARLDAKYRR